VMLNRRFVGLAVVLSARAGTGIFSAAVLAVAVPLAAQAPAVPKAAPTQPATRNQTVAEVDGEAITQAQVEKALGVNLSRLEEQIYTIKRQAIDALISERVVAHEAARRRMTPTALLAAEVLSRVTPVTDQEVEGFYQAHKPELTGKGDEAEIRAQIRSALQTQKTRPQQEAFVQTLISKARVAIHVAPPPVQRYDLDVAGAPFLGPSDAPVTVVEFSDFHCPFCKQFDNKNTIGQLRSRYGDRVKVVWLDDPIDQLHPQSRQAHEAARCASEQGAFWTYHDALYAGPPKAGEALTAVAQEVGLDLATFEECVASGRQRAAVQKDVEEARHLSVTGTPTFFINGRPLFGAQPLDAFVRMIDEELARSTVDTSKSR
jgi:protein-disulfide isomerase